MKVICFIYDNLPIFSVNNPDYTTLFEYKGSYVVDNQYDVNLKKCKEYCTNNGYDMVDVQKWHFCSVDETPQEFLENSKSLSPWMTKEEFSEYLRIHIGQEAVDAVIWN